MLSRPLTRFDRYETVFSTLFSRLWSILTCLASAVNSKLREAAVFLFSSENLLWRKTLWKIQCRAPQQIYLLYWYLECHGPGGVYAYLEVNIVPYHPNASCTLLSHNPKNVNILHKIAFAIWICLCPTSPCWENWHNLKPVTETMLSIFVANFHVPHLRLLLVF